MRLRSAPLGRSTVKSRRFEKYLILKEFFAAKNQWRRGRKKDPKILSVMISESCVAATFRDGLIIAETVSPDCTTSIRCSWFSPLASSSLNPSEVRMLVSTAFLG
jgi:hypothetical protein